MPVEKYRDVSDMPAPPRADEEELVRRIREVWERAVALAGPPRWRGVQRFRSLEEAQAAREALRRGA